MTALLLIATLSLIALNGFFVSGEYALVRARRARLEKLKEEGDHNAALALQQIEEIGAYISTSQVGITLSSIALGIVGEPTIADLLEPLLGDVLSHGLATAISVLVAYLIISSAHIVGGEIVPKLYVIEHAETMSRRLARPFRFFRRLFSPFIVVLTAVSYRILRLLGADPERAKQKGTTPEELLALIAESFEVGQLDEAEAEMLSGVFHLHEQVARQVMTPIPAVITVDLSETAEEALTKGVTSGHTRLVVTENFNPNRLRGMVHTNALARHLMAEGPQASIEGLIREVPVVPETKPLDDLLAEMQHNRAELAIVIDEYGRVAGIVTIEDIIEEIVGEIEEAVGAGTHEEDSDARVRRLPNGDLLVRGHVPIGDLEDYDVDLPDDSDAYTSIGGLVFHELGRLPRRGDVVTVDGYAIRVESVRDNRIEAVRIRPVAGPTLSAEGGGAPGGEPAPQ